MQLLKLLPILLIPFTLAGLKAQNSIDSLKNLADETYNLREEEKYKEAIDAGKKALNYGANIRNADPLIANIYVQLGRSYKELDHAFEALEMYENALRIRNSLADSTGIASVYNNMSSAYEQLSLYSNGLDCSRKAIRIWSGLGRKELLARAYNNLANVLEGLGEVDSAIAYDKKSINLFSITKDTSTLADAYYGLGKRLIQVENYKTVDSVFRIALSHYESLHDERSQALVNEALGLFYLGYEDRIAKSPALFDRCEKVYRDTKDSAGLYRLFLNKSLLFEIKENYALAESSYDSAYVYGKVKAGGAFKGRKSMGGIDDGYTLRTRRSLMLSEKNSKNLTTGLQAALVAVFGLFVYIVYRQYLNSKTQKNLLNTKEELLKTQENLASLKHDVVKSSLNTIKNHIYAERPKFTPETPGYVLTYKIEGLVNRLLRRLGFPHTPGSEISALKPFVAEMHQIAMETALMPVENQSYLDETENIQLSKPIRENLEAIVLEAFHNMYKYADSTKASINFMVNEDGLIMEIEDNGKGFTPDQIREGAEGLKNIKNRAKEMNGRCRIDSTPGKGTKIKITIPSFQ
jgi:tetratricopeptide (TPR) repeat protein